MRRVVVTGLGAVTPAGVGSNSLWQAMQSSRSCEQLISSLESCETRSKIFCPVTGFDPVASGLSADFIKRNDRHILLASIATREAIESSGFMDAHVDRDRIGVNIGTAIAGTGGMEQGFLSLTSHCSTPISGERITEPLYQHMCPASVSIEISAQYDFRGPCVTTSTGCTSGQDAIGYAFNAIRCGDADAFVTGASDAPLVPISIAAFDVIGAITRKPIERVRSASCPFSAERDGFVLGEGSGVAILEELEHAQRRRAHILAEVLGYASTCNAYHMTGLPPDGVDLSRAIDLALEIAGLAPEEIDYINAHGSSTLQNDRNETAAIRRSFNSCAAKIPVSSIKSMIGHALGAANSIEFVVCVQSIIHNFLPPTINYNQAADDCDLDYVPNVGRSHKINSVLSLSSGFSGLHSVLVIRRFCD
jgi:3-oxoacyl-(acyl-carrier-protein) synthase